MKLAQLRSKQTEVLTRTFWFPPDSLPENRFEVTLNYLSPALYAETQEKAKVKYAGARRSGGGDISPAKYRQLIVDEILMKTVQRIDGVTLGKLRRMIPMDADTVGKLGGLDKILPLDPTLKTTAMAEILGEDGVPMTDVAKKELASANIKDLLSTCSEFADWCLDVCTKLEYYQDDAWEDRVKNFGTGGGTSSAPA